MIECVSWFGLDIAKMGRCTVKIPQLLPGLKSPLSELSGKEPLVLNECKIDCRREPVALSVLVTPINFKENLVGYTVRIEQRVVEWEDNVKAEPRSQTVFEFNNHMHKYVRTLDDERRDLHSSGRVDVTRRSTFCKETSSGALSTSVILFFGLASV